MSSPSGKRAQTPHCQELEQSFCNVSIGLLQQLYREGQNLVLSPFSLITALGMLMSGTDGESRAQLKRTLFGEKLDNTDTDKLLAEFAAANKNNMKKNAATLKVANLIYSHKRFTLEPKYVDIVKSKFDAIGKQLDFISKKEEALKTINRDVSEATAGMIPMLLDDIDPNTRLILVNATYFKGRWEKPFEKQLTNEKADFHTSSGKVVKAPLMFKRKRLPFCEEATHHFKAVQLDYQLGGNISMILLLPAPGVTIRDFIQKQLSAVKLKHVLEHLFSGPDVKLSLPRFKISTTHNLVKPLISLGTRDIFDCKLANLSRISSSVTEDLFVSDVIQKAVIEVNEEGTEAAAATAMKMVAYCCAIGPEVDFTADRPFVYALVTMDHPKQVLFIGAVEDPTQK